MIRALMKPTVAAQAFRAETGVGIMLRCPRCGVPGDSSAVCWAGLGHCPQHGALTFTVEGQAQFQAEAPQSLGCHAGPVRVVGP